MRVKDLQIGEMYFSKSHQLVMKYCGVEYFQGHKYHLFYESTWRLQHWLHPQDVSLPNTASSGLAETSAEIDPDSPLVNPAYAVPGEPTANR